jgi:hypothetical protein
LVGMCRPWILKLKKFLWCFAHLHKAMAMAVTVSFLVNFKLEGAMKSF